MVVVVVSEPELAELMNEQNSVILIILKILVQTVPSFLCVTG